MAQSPVPAELDRYRKQILFAPVGIAGQQRLQAATAVVLGCGALGSASSEMLARAGVGRLRIVDRDFVDLSNLQRQSLFTEQDVAERLPKAVAAARRLRAINSRIEIDPLVEDAGPHNILRLIQAADIVVDGTDNFETRYLLNDAAQETRIPWVHAGCVGSVGQMMAIRPGKTACLRCVLPEPPVPGTTETCDSAGVIAPAIQIMASLQVVDVLKILTGQADLIPPVLTIVDVWNLSLRHINLAGVSQAQNCPCCQGTERLWLQGQRGTQSAVLCGRNSVQLAPALSEQGSLAQLADRLRSSGEVRSNPFLVVFRPHDGEFELTIFQDGRVIVTGTNDPAEARSVHARYLGL